MTTTSSTYRDIAEKIVNTYFEGTAVTQSRHDLGLKVDALEAALPTLDLSDVSSKSDDALLTLMDGIFDTSTGSTGQMWRDRYLDRIKSNGAEWVRLINEAKAAAEPEVVRYIRASREDFTGPFPMKVTILPDAAACGGNKIINGYVAAGCDAYISSAFCDSDGDQYVYVPVGDYDDWAEGKPTQWSGYIDQQFVVPLAGQPDIKALPAGTKVRIKPGATYASGIGVINRWVGRVVTILRGPDSSGDYACRFSTEDGGGDTWVHFNGVEVVEPVVETVAETVAETVVEPEKVATQAEIDAARSEAAEQRRKTLSLCRVLNEWLNDKADEQNMCDEYEDALSDLNDLIRQFTSYDFTGRVREVEAEGYMTVNLEVRVPWSDTFEAARGSDIHEEARERIEDADLSDYDLNDAASEAIRRGDYSVEECYIENVS